MLSPRLTSAAACGWNLTLSMSGALLAPGTPVVAMGQGPDTNPLPVPVTAAGGPSGPLGTFDPVNAGRVCVVFDALPLTPGPYTVTLFIQSAKPYTFRCDLPPVGFTEARAAIHTGGPTDQSGVDPFPLPEVQPGIGPFPSRDAILNIRQHFQGAFITSRRYSGAYGGPLPWFTAALTSFGQDNQPDDEIDDIIDQLAALGDTHISVSLEWDYGEAGQPWGTGQIVPGRDLTENYISYRSICDRVIAKGKIPIYVLPSDSQTGQGGWPFGYQWTLDNLPRFVSEMRQGYDRLRYGVIQLGYDGTWPVSWSVDQIIAGLPAFRSIIGDNAVLAMMFANGPGGEPYLFVQDESDYSKPWMQALDIVMTSTTPPTFMTCPQLANFAQYMIDPSVFNPGACAPQWHGPYLLGPGTPRGPYGWLPIEWAEYQWVRNQIDQASINSQRALALALGCTAYG